MPTDITLSDITVTIPSLGDGANIVTAFTDYHTDLAASVAVLGRATNTFTGDVVVNGGDITTTATTATLFNTNATTLSFGGAATTLTIGATTGTATIRNATVAITNAATIGTTLGVTGNTTLTGDLAVNGGDLTSSASTFNLLASPTTVNLAAAGTALTIGATTGTATIRNATVAVTNALTVGTTLSVTGNTTLTGDLAVNGGDITTTATGTATVFNTNATTLNIGGAATTITIGAGTGNVNFQDNISAEGYVTARRASTQDSVRLIGRAGGTSTYDAIITPTTLTATRTFTLPNESGFVVVTSDGDIALGTDTAGNYVASVATGSGLSGGASGSEGAAISLGIDTAIVATLTNSQTLTNKTLTSPTINTAINMAANATIIFEGTTADAYETTLTVVDPTVSDKTIILPDANGTVAVQNNLVIASDFTDSISTTTSSTKTSDALGKLFPALANTAYKIDFAIHVYHSLLGPGGNGDATLSFRFALPSGATIKSDFDYRLDALAEGDASAVSSVYKEVSSASTDIITIDSVISASDTGYTVIKGSGIIRVGATAGDIGPTLYLVANNLGSTSSVSFTTAADSYCIVQPIGTTGEINTGSWA
jgi:hypothetical protein